MEHMWKYIIETIILSIITIGALIIYKDAKKRRMNSFLWAYIAILLPVIGWLFYLLIRTPDKKCHNCNERINREDLICSDCKYNFKRIAEEKGLVNNYKKASLMVKIKSFFTGLKQLSVYIFKIIFKGGVK